MAGAAVIIVALAVLLVGLVLRARGLGDAADVAQLVSVLLAVAPLLVAVVVWARHPHPATTSAREPLEVLAESVRDQWDREHKRRAVADPGPIAIEWVLSDRSAGSVLDLARAARRPGSAGPRRPPSPETVVRGEHGARRLVLLGGPGAGKTTFAVELILALLAPRSRTAGDPVPVLLTLAGWDVGSSPLLADWVAAGLDRDYPALRAFGDDTGRSLVRRGLIIPVLDGLDEIPAENRGAVITALNLSLRADEPLILTCRTQDYELGAAAGDPVLRSAAVFEPEPLTAEQAAEYLESVVDPARRTAWRDVLDQLRSGAAGPLAEICSRPLGLWLVRVAYVAPARDPQPLLDPWALATMSGSGAENAARVLESHLYERLVPTLLTTGEQRRRQAKEAGVVALSPTRYWEAERVRTYLTFLAGVLSEVGTADLRWWDLASHRLRPRLTRLTYGVGAGVVLWGLDRYFFGVSSLPATAFYVFVGAVVGGSLVALRRGPVSVNLRLAGRRRQLFRLLTRGVLGVGMLVGLALAVVLVLAVALYVPGVFSRFSLDVLRLLGLLLVAGLSFGVAVGLAVGFRRWVQKPSAADPAESPVTTLRATRRFLLLEIALYAGSAAVVWVVVDAVFGGTSLGAVARGAATGFVVGCQIAIVVVPPRNAWWIFTLTATFEAVRGRLPAPWRMMTFLEDCARLGFLRHVGPTYQFRHASFQDHLAGRLPDED